jgi:hypothetical protein
MRYLKQKDRQRIIDKFIWKLIENRICVLRFSTLSRFSGRSKIVCSSNWPTSNKILKSTYYTQYRIVKSSKKKTKKIPLNDEKRLTDYEYHTMHENIKV